MASLLTSFTATANTADPDPSNLGRDDMNTVTGTLHGGDSVNTKATTSAHSDANVPTDASALNEEGTVGSIDAVARTVSEPKAAGRGTESDPKKATRYIALLGKMGGLEAIEGKESKGPGGEEAREFVLCLKKACGLGRLDVGYLPAQPGDELKPSPTEEWWKENDCAPETIMKDWRIQKGIREQREPNLHLIVPDDSDTPVKWIRFATTLYPAGDLIVRYIV